MIKRRRGAWRVSVANQLQRLRDELAVLPEPPERERASFAKRRQVVEEHLDRAEEAIQPVGPLTLVRDWYSGSAIEIAWSSLHRASEVLLFIQSPQSLAGELADIEVAFESGVRGEDPRRAVLTPALAEARKLVFEEQRPEAVTEALRAKLVAARRAANATSDAAHDAVRKWRNALSVSGMALAAVALAVAVIPAFVDDFLSLRPATSPGAESPAEPWEVELVGAVGGAVAAVLALNRFKGFTDPHGLPTVQALVRVPMSAVTSLFGVVLMQTSALDVLQPQRGTAVLAFAFVFGYAQEPLLRMIDKQAATVLDPARDKNEPATRELKAGAAGA